MATQPPRPQTKTRHSSRPVNGDGPPASVLVKEFLAIILSSLLTHGRLSADHGSMSLFQFVRYAGKASYCANRPPQSDVLFLTKESTMKISLLPLSPTTS